MCDPVFMNFDFLQRGLRAFGIRPEIRIQRELLFFF
jgi:hypothetical protein